MKPEELTDGQILWQGLSAAPIQLLASNLALLEETSFLSVIGKKAESLWKRDGDEFARLLEKRAKELRKLPEEVLILHLLGKLRGMARLEAQYFLTNRDLIDACQQIAVRAVEFQRDDDKEFQGESLSELISYQIQRILGELKKKFPELDADQKDKIISQLKEFLAELPEEQQEQILDQLGVDEITGEVIQTAIINGTLSIAFATLVNTLGFSFYLGAVSVLATIASLAGLTLPFAAYTTLTSAIAVLANPLTIAILLVLLLSFGWWSSEKTLREKVLPLAVVQLVSAQPAKNLGQPNQLEWKVLIKWYMALYVVEYVRDRLSDLDVEHQKLQGDIDQAQDKMQARKKNKHNYEKERESIWMRVQELVLERSSQIAAGDWGLDLIEKGRLIRKEQKEADASGEEEHSNSLLRKIRDGIVDEWENYRGQQKIKSLAIRIVEALKQKGGMDGIYDPDLLIQLRSIAACVDKLSRAEDALREAEDILIKLRVKLGANENQKAFKRDVLQSKLQAYPGLKEAAELPDTFPLMTPEKPPVLTEEVWRYLRDPLIPESEDERLRRLLTGGQGDVAFAGFTVGDFIYDCARLDPTVIEAVDFARAADIEDRLSFTAFAIEQSALEDAAEMGMVNQLQGYVAERLVAEHMSATGYDVSFPQDSNQPGWDVLIDGNPFQIKCGISPDLVHEHFEKYPEIPVIVNRELGEALGNTPGVYIDEELSVEHVRSLTEAGLQQGVEVANFELPLIALTVSAAIEVRSLLRGEGTVETAIINILTNTGGRIVGGTGGGLAGSAIGVILFGPAGSIIGGLAGTVGGGISGVELVRRARSLLATKEADVVQKAAQKLARQAELQVLKKRDVWSAKQKKILALSLPTNSDGYQLKKYLNWRMCEQGVYLKKCTRELKLMAKQKPDGDPVQLATHVLSAIKRTALHPHFLQDELNELFKAVETYTQKLANYKAGV